MRARNLVVGVLLALSGCGESGTGTTPDTCDSTLLDDGNPCTIDACDTKKHEITHQGIPGCTLTVTTAGAPSPRRRHTALRVGTEMLIWGGSVAGTPPVTNTGGRYDPETDTWKPISTIGAPSARHSHCAVWSGETQEMLVWGGYGETSALNTGGRYDPKTDTWKPMSTVGAPSGRTGFTCTYTGELVVWGGMSGGQVLGDGARYDAVTDTWKPLASAGAPSARYGHVAVWNGSAILVWGGTTSSTGTMMEPGTPPRSTAGRR